MTCYSLVSLVHIIPILQDSFLLLFFKMKSLPINIHTHKKNADLWKLMLFFFKIVNTWDCEAITTFDFKTSFYTGHFYNPLHYLGNATEEEVERL